MKNNTIYFVVENTMDSETRKLSKLFLKKDDAIKTAKWLNEDLKDLSTHYTVEEWRKYEK